MSLQLTGSTCAVESGQGQFRYIYRGFREAMVLIPGWATDYRIFSTLDLNYNYLLPLKVNPLDFKKKLLGELERNCLNKISILGWSLGGFLATEFFIDNPERINELILLSIRKRYDSAGLKEIAARVKKNKKAWLYKFYLSCFSGKDKKGLFWFKKELLRDYLKTITLPELLCGLEYLSSAEFQSELLKTFKRLTVFHGKDDLIAPFKEALEIKSELPQAEFIGLSNSGHIPFLSRQFSLFMSGIRAPFSLKAFHRNVSLRAAKGREAIFLKRSTEMRSNLKKIASA